MIFKVSGYLYLHHEEHGRENLALKAIEVLNAAFVQYRIESIEERDENKETAISFESTIEADSEQLAEEILLTSMTGYDVDNYSFSKIGLERELIKEQVEIEQYEDDKLFKEEYDKCEATDVSEIEDWEGYE